MLLSCTKPCFQILLERVSLEDWKGLVATTAETSMGELVS